MNSDIEIRGQEALIVELRRRFPLVEQIVGQFGKNLEEEQIPWFFALLMSAAANPTPGACCFVLDKTLGTTAIVAVLLALAKLKSDFPRLSKEYAQTALTLGQRVRVKPSDYVYEYDGIYQEFPHLFRLRELEDDTTARSFPLGEVLRLEPTERVRPKGRGNTELGEFETSSLDNLLNLTTCGNNSLIRNTVLLHMAQSRFVGVLSGVALAPESTKLFERLAEFLPWGTIGQNGELKPNDVYQVTGEPIVAVTKVVEDVALASKSAKIGSKVVLVDGAHGVTRDLQALDDISERQRVVILASSDEIEALDLLKSRDCPIWYMPPKAVMMGETSKRKRLRNSYVGGSVHAAHLRQKQKVTVVECQDEVLQSIAISLAFVSDRIQDIDDVSESEEILSRLFGVLLECSECCFGVGVETKNLLERIYDRLARNARWLDRSVFKELREIYNRLERVVNDRNYGKEKAEALLENILDQNQESLHIVARSQRTANCLRESLGDFGVNVPIYPVYSIAFDSEPTCIVLPAWLNDQRFTRLKHRALTPDIRVLAYPFELDWISRHKVKESKRERSNKIEVEDLSLILDLDPFLIKHLVKHSPESIDSERNRFSHIFDTEERVAARRVSHPTVAKVGQDSREATLVQYYGDCYSLLTEWAELPRLNELLDRSDASETKLTSVGVSELQPGDFVLFRASGDKEFIRLIAEDILGQEEYEKNRTLAERWRSSLRSLGASASEVQQCLADHGLNRTTATIGGWLGNMDRIGPGNLKDIEFIAAAAGDTELSYIKEKVGNAISRIRGSHIAAGSQLTQLLLGELDGRLNQLSEQPVLLDLDYGEAWIVQVQVIEEKPRQYPSNLINRLLNIDGLDY